MRPIPEDSHSSKYLVDRGVSPAFAVECGALWTDSEEEIRERLGLAAISTAIHHRFSDPQRRFRGRELLSFPVRKTDGWYLSKVLPVDRDDGSKGFRATLRSQQPMFIAPMVYALAKDATKPLFLVEGPVKASSVNQAGGLAIGLGGHYMTEGGAGGRKHLRQVMEVITKDFRLFGRDVYLALDADQFLNEGVRLSVIRNALALAVEGANVWQLTSWTVQEGKGIDDYLFNQKCGHNQEPSETLNFLVKKAEPWIETLRSNDLGLLKTSLDRIKMEEAQHADFAKKFGAKLKVPARVFGKYRQNKSQEESQPQAKTLFTRIEPWEKQVDGKKLLEVLIKLILKHVYISPEGALVVALWILWTYLVHEDFVEYSPFLGITGADKRVGKSRLLKLVEKLARKSYSVGRLSEAALYRLIEQYRPTLLIDEFHRLLSKYPNLLDLFLVSYERDKKVTLANAETHQLDEFECWSAKAFAYLGILDEQLRDRIIEIYLKRKPPNYTNCVCNSPRICKGLYRTSNCRSSLTI